MQRAKTTDEYVEWIQQAIFEVQDLKDCLEYYLDEQGKYPAFLAPLEQGVQSLLEAMKQGVYVWGSEDLPFLALAKKHASDIPFVYLLERINATHRKGLDIDEKN